MLPFSSYTCGGVGHLSRDCAQGSKCYNCSGTVCFFFLSVNRSLLTWLCRVTQAGTAPRRKNERATLVAQKDTFLVIALDLRRLMKVLPKRKVHSSGIIVVVVVVRLLLYHTCLHSSILSPFFSCFFFVLAHMIQYLFYYLYTLL